MHGTEALGVVLEEDFDGVADFGANERAQNAQVLPFRWTRLRGLEGAVGVLVVDRFGIDAVLFADALITALEVRQTGQGPPTRRVIPGDVVGRDVIGAKLSALKSLGQASGAQQQHGNQKAVSSQNGLLELVLNIQPQLCFRSCG